MRSETRVSPGPEQWEAKARTATAAESSTPVRLWTFFPGAVARSWGLLCTRLSVIPLPCDLPLRPLDARA